MGVRQKFKVGRHIGSLRSFLYGLENVFLNNMKNE